MTDANQAPFLAERFQR